MAKQKKKYLENKLVIHKLKCITITVGNQLA